MITWQLKIINKQNVRKKSLIGLEIVCACLKFKVKCLGNSIETYDACGMYVLFTLCVFSVVFVVNYC